ncbi:MAG: Cu(I)-responsive transcriptional regulator [Porticoccaceae bacterium]|nr:Cu(I)-responsive transcriptional regulator [Pseudomonadales bacterium]MCP5171401.1 Cu(I)-responsive transcriptional regulator [Pseudomonadales bacterium]
MNIGHAAKQSGLSSETIRYYESVGLITPSSRGANGYREYNEDKIRELNFLRHARQFGFSLEDCKTLLGLYKNPDRRSSDVHELVAEKLTEIERRIVELQSMKRVLEEMSGQCPNNEEASCTIIDSLARIDGEKGYE